MRILLVVLALIHGLCHLPGFLSAWKLAELKELPYRTTILGGRVDLGETGIRGWGLLWLLLAAGFAAAAIGVWVRSPDWLRGLTILVILSLLACLLGLPETKVGIAANLAILAAISFSFRYPGSEAGLLVRDPSLEALWVGAAPPPGDAPPTVEGVMLRHSIAPGAKLATRARIWMKGEIKLGAAWFPFRGEQVIDAQGGMVWAANVSMMGLPVRGFDRVLGGTGRMSWRIFDLLPVADAAGPDIDRSARERWLAEAAAWLPTVLLLAPGEAEWLPSKPGEVNYRFRGLDISARIDPAGRIRRIEFPRWGNPGGGAKFELSTFRVDCEAEKTFQGFTVPSRIRAGWQTGDDAKFEKEGAFFRAEMERIEYR